MKISALLAVLLIASLPVAADAATSKILPGLSTTVTDVKTSPGQVDYAYCWNPNASVAYLQIFNAAHGAVTLGATLPTQFVPIGPSRTDGIALPPGTSFGTAISAAVTTTATGASAPSSPLDCNLGID